MEAKFVGECEGLTFWLARPQDYDEVMAISHGIYQGSDYLPHRYHIWMTEPDRVVIIGRRNGKLVALDSALVVDEGKTVVLEGLRVCPTERGHGVAGIIQKVTDSYIKQVYPSLKGKLEKTEKANEHNNNNLKLIVVKDSHKLKALLLDPDLSLRLQLPGGAIIQDWQPLKPIESNLKILERRNLTWLVDCFNEKPVFMSFHTPAYPIPFRGGSLRLNIDMFGTDINIAKKALIEHLEMVLEEIHGNVAVHIFMPQTFWEAMKQFCDGDEGVKQFRDYTEQLFLETEMLFCKTVQTPTEQKLWDKDMTRVKAGTTAKLTRETLEHDEVLRLRKDLNKAWHPKSSGERDCPHQAKEHDAIPSPSMREERCPLLNKVACGEEQ
ncbi:putative N-acetyltransferase 16 [Bagarius yarrelli]|uniref:Putative N-acetyltransferase 16 n=1 Tax=Bagarius yarrelli TaxID=175774 RepID=A0A556TYY4_BAGYA|nr:putative N-acetyltransferase 16 [Bagarius yarrelli]